MSEWQIDAFKATVALAEKCGMQRHGDLGLDHLKDMLSRIDHSFSRGKIGRWLGWAQAAVVASNCGPTLEDMKALNAEKSALAREALSRPEPVAVTEAMYDGGGASTSFAYYMHFSEFKYCYEQALLASPSPPASEREKIIERLRTNVHRLHVEYADLRDREKGTARLQAQAALDTTAEVLRLIGDLSPREANDELRAGNTHGR